ncbi:MAG: NfeD family protein [Anaerolineales bacterium]
MNTYWRGFCVLLLLVLAASFIVATATAQGEGQALLLQARGPITPAMAEYLERGIRTAETTDAPVVIFQMDTPGGAIDTMNRMVQSIRGSQIPVVVYVAPRGAIAGSAGTVITLAGHAAGMAPETAIGAASPVGGQGEDLNETLEAKTKEILKATARGLANRRGQEAVELAEATIEEARAVSAEEALSADLIDVVAQDVEELLASLDGLTVEVNGQSLVLETAGVSVQRLDQNAVEQILQALTNPNLVFLLLAVGVQAVLIELSSPGGWLAGFIGVVSLALAAYGLGILPVNWFGLIFVLTAFVLFFLEIKAATHGALAAVGMITLIAGALVLFNSPGSPDFFRVSIGAVVAIAGGTAAFFLWIVGSALRAQGRPVRTGSEALIGKVVTVQSDLDPVGKIKVAGEIWRAELEQGSAVVEAGQQVVITAVEGLQLRVEPHDDQVS